MRFEAIFRPKAPTWLEWQTHVFTSTRWGFARPDETWSDEGSRRPSAVTDYLIPVTRWFMSWSPDQLICRRTRCAAAAESRRLALIPHLPSEAGAAGFVIDACAPLVLRVCAGGGRHDSSPPLGLPGRPALMWPEPTFAPISESPRDDPGRRRRSGSCGSGGRGWRARDGGFADSLWR